MEKKTRIYISGADGLVGSALINELNKRGYDNIITKSHKELDLTEQLAINNFFKTERPEYVFVAAGKVGGIYANSIYPAEFAYINSMIAINTIHAAYKFNVKKLLYLGSSCIYPKECPQPMKEEYLLSGSLEKTNEAYAIAKIFSLKLCEFYNRQYNTNFITCMPTNLYGPNDNYNLENSHVLPALIKKIHIAKINGDKEVILWGTGKAEREFLHVNDLADACIFLMNNYKSNETINIGYGHDITIMALAEIIKKIIGYSGKIIYDNTKPDGTMKKLLDITKITNLGWAPRIKLKDGIANTYEDFKCKN